VEEQIYGVSSIRVGGCVSICEYKICKAVPEVSYFMWKNRSMVYRPFVWVDVCLSVNIKVVKLFLKFGAKVNH